MAYIIMIVALVLLFYWFSKDTLGEGDPVEK